MMYYQYIVPNPFYKLKYNVTTYKQFFYDVLVSMMFPFMNNDLLLNELTSLYLQMSITIYSKRLFLPLKYEI